MNLLILSVGSNPMPNFITANYLLCNNRDELEQQKLPIPIMIMFVYSSETEKFKKTIVAQLSLNSDKFIEVNLEDKYREFGYVKKKVLTKMGFLAKTSSITSIHLNYTGGTKSMAVGISSAVEDFENCNNKIYSDLSPDSFKLALWDGNKFPTDGDIRDVVNISVEKLYELHALEKPKLKRKNNDLYDDKFIKFLIDKKSEHKRGDKNFYEDWRKWPGKKKDKDNRKILKKNSDKYNKFKESLECSVKHYFPNTELDLIKINALKKFICGLWLEEYLFTVLQEIKNDCGLTDIAWNVETKIKGRPFELDVIAMKGCQSFVFTCTTDYSSGLCKGKAFEGIYRSEQIGGEHSKTVLVCMADDLDENGKPTTDNDKKIIENIIKDMSQFDAANNFYILGSEDIKNCSDFKEKMKKIINGDI